MPVRTPRSVDRRLTDASKPGFRITRPRRVPWRAVLAGSATRTTAWSLEAMAQQTQLSRVLERLPAFLVRFPDGGELPARQ